MVYYVWNEEAFFNQPVVGNDRLSVKTTSVLIKAISATPAVPQYAIR